MELSTGLRRGEICALQWDDLNLHTGELRVERQVHRVRGELVTSPPKTKAGNRSVILPAPVLGVLNEYKKSVRSRWMFPSPVREDSPRDPAAVRKRLQTVLDRAECKKIRFHDLRHTFSTAALEHGMDVKTLSTMPDKIQMLQRQTLDLLTQIWITDTSERSVDEKLTACYLGAEQAGKELFHFRPQRMSYEMLYRETFAEILCPDTVYDLVDYHLRECLKREIKMRVCKNCGRLFAVTGHGGIEYCDRPFDEKGRTCKEIGAFRVWERSKSEDEVFKIYRREYKKRFAWIRAGRITKDEFYAWSERTREKRAECEEGKITLEEFERWLRDS